MPEQIKKDREADIVDKETRPVEEDAKKGSTYRVGPSDGALDYLPGAHDGRDYPVNVPPMRGSSDISDISNVIERRGSFPITPGPISGETRTGLEDLEDISPQISPQPAAEGDLIPQGIGQGQTGDYTKAEFPTFARELEKYSKESGLPRADAKLIGRDTPLFDTDGGRKSKPEKPARLPGWVGDVVTDDANPSSDGKDRVAYPQEE
jgi:hypothetical protein